MAPKRLKVWDGTADFTITSDIMPNSRGLTLYYLPVSTSFLPTGVSTNQQVTPQALVFTQAANNGPITTTLSVPLDNDDIAEAKWYTISYLTG